MNMRLCSFFALLLILFNSCTKSEIKNKVDSKKDVISGTLKSNNNNLIFLSEWHDNRFINIDSSKIDKNSGFEFTLKDKKEKTLFIRDNNFIYPIEPLSTVNFYTIDAENPLESKSDPNDNLDFLRKITELNKKEENLYPSIKRTLINGNHIADLREKFISIQNSKRSIITKYIKSNPNTILSKWLLIEGKNNHVITSDGFESLVTSIDENSEFCKKNIESIKNNIKLEKKAKEEARLARIEELKNEKRRNYRKYVDFSGPSPNGADLSLSASLGKVTLVDFWASWCGPCRNQSPFLVQLYKKYHNDGFNILSVSEDRSGSEWMQAIQDDKLNWSHILDTNQRISSRYAVSSIPFTFLIDDEGYIIAEHIYGDELERKIKELLYQ